MARSDVHLRRQARRFLDTESPTATRYPVEFRVEAVEFARKSLARGTAVSRVARDLGLRPRTLQIWLRSTPRRRMRQVRVVPESTVTPTPVPRVVVVTAMGVRVEGLDVEAAAKLLRLLA